MSYLFLHNLLLCLGTALYFTGYKYSEMIISDAMATLGWHLDSFWKKKNLNWGSFWTILVYGHVQGHSLLLINVGGSSLQWVIPVWQVDLVCKRKADEQVRGIMSESRVPLWSLFQFLPLVSCLVSLQDGLYPISWSNPHSILDFVLSQQQKAN